MRRFASWRRRVGWAIAVLLLAYTGLIGLRILYPIAYTSQLVDAARENGLDPAFVAAVVRCESRFKPSAVSPVGAVGLMQIMPETGAWIAEQLAVVDFTTEKLCDPDINLRFGAWYLRWLLDRFGTRNDALMAYNAGPNRADEWLSGSGAVFPETQGYVARVTRSLPVYRFYFAIPWLLRITPSLLL